MANELTWHDVLAEEKQQPYFLNTLQTVASERQSGLGNAGDVADAVAVNVLEAARVNLVNDGLLPPPPVFSGFLDSLSPVCWFWFAGSMFFLSIRWIIAGKSVRRR